MVKYSALAILLSVILAACNNKTVTVNNNTTSVVRDTVEKDVHTLSNADSVAITHLDLDIKVSFEKKQISGCATWTIGDSNKQHELRLDTYDLSIDSVFVNGQKTTFKLDSAIKYLGSALHIPILSGSNLVAIHYRTGKNAEALQWLDPQQTLDKKHPFLYTQSESIHARSWIPCPDGPGIRFTYNARVEAPKGMLALMSAENPQQVNDSNIYHFRMENPVPAYLMALAVGDIAFRKID
ncbi:MAG: aminopeptidase, partial [Bacteroidetes bacterium]|nr:aminopeptidase [Bacteroidota bacterium]